MTTETPDRTALTRYRSATRRQPLPGWGTPPPDGPLVKERRLLVAAAEEVGAGVMVIVSVLVCLLEL